MTQQEIALRLVQICCDDVVLQNSNHPDIVNADFSSGCFDSMSLVFLQALIEEEWGVHVPGSYFAARLRNLNSIATYIAEQIESRRRISDDASSIA